MRVLLVTLTTLAAGERLPEYPDCIHACDQTEHIYPDSGNQKRVWPACTAADGDCHSQCADVDPNCKQYVAAHGGYGCEDNPAFMLTQCPSACNVCHLLQRQDRCGMLADYPPALQPGDVNRTFERMTQLEDIDVEVLSTDPWVVLVRGAMRDDEIELLLRERQVREMRGSWEGGGAVVVGACVAVTAERRLADPCIVFVEDTQGGRCGAVC